MGKDIKTSDCELTPLERFLAMGKNPVIAALRNGTTKLSDHVPKKTGKIRFHLTDHNHKQIAYGTMTAICLGNGNVRLHSENKHLNEIFAAQYLRGLVDGGKSEHVNIFFESNDAWVHHKRTDLAEFLKNSKAGCS